MTLGHGTGDPTRIAAQIVTGIGFLGAGTILRNRDGVHGLTTAATVWVNAALGVAAGGGQYQLAIIAAVIVLTVLLVLGPIEAAIEMKSGPKRRRDGAGAMCGARCPMCDMRSAGGRGANYEYRLMSRSGRLARGSTRAITADPTRRCPR